MTTPPTAPVVGVTPYVSFLPDDLPDPPFSLEDCCPGYFIIDGEICLVGPEEALNLFSWAPYELGGSNPPPVGDSTPHIPDRISLLPDALATQPGPAPIPVDVAAVPVSAFTNRFEKIPAQVYTVLDWLGFIRDGVQAKTVAAIRDSRGTPRYDALKKQLPCVSFSGTFPLGRAGKFPSDASGLVFVEVDFHDGAPPEGWLKAEQARLSAHPAVVSVYTSAGGAGLHAVVAVDPVPVDRPSYRQAWAWATRELALEDRSDPAVKDSTRLACISHDPGLYVNLTPTPIPWQPNTLSSTGRKGQNSTRQHTPADLAQGFRAVASHFGVEFTGTSDADCEAGLRMHCPYHGGDNPTSLHVWLGQREVTDKRGKSKMVPTLFGKCHSRDCDGPVVLRYLAREAGFRWPVSSGVQWSAQPMDALSDTLALLRLDIRMNRSTGGIEVRPWEGFEPDRILAESGIPFRLGWVSIGGSVFDKALRLTARDSFHINGTLSDWTDALLVTASASQYSGFPFRDDYLEQLDDWDGVSRLPTLFIEALGAEDSTLNRVAATAFMLGAVRRVYEPGCPHDWMCVLVGSQGLGKSRTLRELLPAAMQLDMFAENLDLSQSTQQIAEGVGGAVIVEFSEMAGVRSVRATEGFKAFLSARNDRYRRPYHHEPSSNPRTWVGCGTANDEAIPSDPSGSRRYLAVQCGEVAKWGFVPEFRDRLWSEALALYHDWVSLGSQDPAPNLLPPELREAQEAANSLHTGSDATMEALADALEPLAAKYAGRSNGAKLIQLWEMAHRQRSSNTAPGLAAHIPPFEKPEQTRFGAALGVAGWTKFRYNGRWYWYR